MLILKHAIDEALSVEFPQNRLPEMPISKHFLIDACWCLKSIITLD